MIASLIQGLFFIAFGSVLIWRSRALAGAFTKSGSVFQRRPTIQPQDAKNRTSATRISIIVSGCVFVLIGVLFILNKATLGD